MQWTLPSNEELRLYRSLFNVREDVFAIRWEKGKKKGYYPAYQFDPYRYRLHKIKGGSLKDFPDKSPLKLDDSQLMKHFSGDQFIGGYPLLHDNISWFIAADFDGEKWIAESLKFIEACQKHYISPYLERSQSGNGAHVWVFFDEAYPAFKSRSVITFLLEKAEIISEFDKSSSFDRLFPNQDQLSGKKLGNLIALPFQGKSLSADNSCFINSNTLTPFEDQWDFISNIKRTEVQILDKIYNEITDNSSKVQNLNNPGKLIVRLNNYLHLSKVLLTSEIRDFLKEELNIANSEYFAKRASGRSIHDTRRYFNLIEEKATEVMIPRGFTGQLIRFLKSNDIKYFFDDQRVARKSIIFESNIQLLSHQEIIFESIRKKNFGVIVAPPGAGKTVVGLQIIAEKEQPAIIVVHRKQLAEQWFDGIQSFLKIPKKEIGMIGNGKNKLGGKITIAMIQSLTKKLQSNPEIAHQFGTLIIDECHHIPADNYRNTISKLYVYYQYGLTATPFRKYSDGKMIFRYIGEMIADIKPTEIESIKRAKIIIRETSFEFPFDPKIDQFENLSKVLIHDTSRNRLIVNDVIAEIKSGRRAIILTERKEHILVLNQFLKHQFEVVTLTGDYNNKEKDLIWQKLKAGDYQILITTGQYFGEGSDLKNATRLFLAFPFSFKGKLIQYIGRVQRSEVTPVIYDYHDDRISYLHRLFLKRNSYYRSLDRQKSLFEDLLEVPITSGNHTIDEIIDIPIENLDFQFGLIAFTYVDKGLKIELSFEIENLSIRPEFSILKGYFSKMLNSKTVNVQIHAELQNHLLIAQRAVSEDIQKIDRGMIESVKFSFIENKYMKGRSLAKERIETFDLSKDHELSSLYSSEEEIIDSMLTNLDAKHGRQLKYLAEKHQSHLVKLRFVLHPFSFLFLIAGEQQFHIVLETLDTEEATYIWHYEKDLGSLKGKIQEVGQALKIIRNEGRLKYQEQAVANFNRIVHDYSDDRKGFILWRDQLEERLV